MAHKILFALLLSGLCGCSSPTYVLIKRSQLNTVDMENTLTKYIPISDSDLDSSKVLGSVYHLIEIDKYKRLEKYIQSIEVSEPISVDLYLAKTLLLISQTNYLDADYALRKIGDADYILLKQLLSIDLDYEIAKMNYQSDFNYFIKRYQDLIDAHPGDKSLEKIVALRIRYIRYNY